MGHVTKKDLQRIRVRIPPLQEQRAIAHILGTLDDKIELNRRMSQTLEAMARALFKAWFVDFEPVRAKMEGRWQRGQSLPGLPAHLYDLFPARLVDSELGEIPEGWEVGTLGELSEKPQYGYTASAKEEPVGPKFLRITDINKLPWIDWSTVPYCEIEPEDFEQYRLHSGDVLIARMADPGHGVVIEEQVEAVFASYLIRFRLKDQAYIRYIQYWLRSDGYWELVTSRYAGTTRASLNAQVLGSFQLIIPLKPIVSAFSEIVNALRNKVVAAAGESRTLAALRDALLPKLIRGEIRVKDAERFLKERGLW
jgi:type I restriction enzyme S subunit